MEAAELWSLLQGLMDRGVPLHKVDVLVSVDGYHHVAEFEFRRDPETGRREIITEIEGYHP